MKYAICSNIELAKFIADRHLRLDTGRRAINSTPKRQDYLKALRKADKTPSFRFLDLHPELRNRVYGELLTFKDSFTCQPNILAASQQTKGEATGILYGDNLIEVKIWADGVYANGWKCGEYDSANPDFTELRWPEFLRRVQFVGFKVGADYVDHEGANRPANIENVFYSLCKFLSEGHRLRSLEVDLARKDATGAPVTTCVRLRAVVLLKPLRHCSVNGKYLNVNEVIPRDGTRTHIPDFLQNLVLLQAAQKFTVASFDWFTAGNAHHEGDFEFIQGVMEKAEDLAGMNYESADSGAKLAALFIKFRRLMEQHGQIQTGDDLDKVLDKMFDTEVVVALFRAQEALVADKQET